MPRDSPLTPFVSVPQPAWVKAIKRRRTRRVVGGSAGMVAIAGGYVARVLALGDGVGFVVIFAVVTIGIGSYTAMRFRRSVTKEHMTGRLALAGIEPDDVGCCIVFDDDRPRGGHGAYLVSEPDQLRVFDDGRPFDKTTSPRELAPVADASVERVTMTPGLFGVGRFVELQRPQDPPLRLYVHSTGLAMLHAHFERATLGSPAGQP